MTRPPPRPRGVRRELLGPEVSIVAPDPDDHVDRLDRAADKRGSGHPADRVRRKRRGLVVDWTAGAPVGRVVVALALEELGKTLDFAANTA